MSFKDGLLSFQGHPVLHAYVDENTKLKLDSMGIERVFLQVLRLLLKQIGKIEFLS